MSRVGHIVLAWALLLLAAGCGEPGDAGGGTAAVEVGTGEWEFVPLVDGEEVTLTAGSQGGFHVWTSVRSAGVSTGRVRMEITTTTEGSPFEPEHSDVMVDMTPADGMAAFLGWPAQLLHPGCADGHIVHLEARVTDRAGVTGHDERDIVVRWNAPEGVDTSCR